MNSMGLGDDKSIKTDITKNFVTQNFILLYKNSTQQMDNLDQTIKNLEKIYTSSLKATPSNSLYLGISIAALAMAIIGITKSQFPEVW